MIRDILFIMEYEYLTTKACLSFAKIKYDAKAYHIIGKRISDAFFIKYKSEPNKVLTINSKNKGVKPCSLYPVEFEPIMQDIIIKYFSETSEG